MNALLLYIQLFFMFYCNVEINRIKNVRRSSWKTVSGTHVNLKYAYIYEWYAYVF